MNPPPSDLDQLRLLGQPLGDYPQDYAPHLLEAFANRHSDAEAWTTFVCPEFTSLCPKTGWPDFARITINYIAAQKMVESKSLKLYLFSFRNHGAFHEDCVQVICRDLVNLLNPRFIEVIGEFMPRGGIAIHPYVSWANEGKYFQDLKQYRQRNYRLDASSPQ